MAGASVGVGTASAIYPLVNPPIEQCGMIPLFLLQNLLSIFFVNKGVKGVNSDPFVGNNLPGTQDHTLVPPRPTPNTLNNLSGAQDHIKVQHGSG